MISEDIVNEKLCIFDYDIDSSSSLNNLNVLNTFPLRTEILQGKIPPRYAYSVNGMCKITNTHSLMVFTLFGQIL